MVESIQLNALEVNIGDTVNLPVPIYRKRWQFWLPRVIGCEMKRFVIINYRNELGIWRMTTVPEGTMPFNFV